jgi:hypothetical protein
VTTWNALELTHIDRLSREELIAAIRAISAAPVHSTHAGGMAPSPGRRA